MANAGNLVGEISSNFEFDFSHDTHTTNVRNNALSLDFSGRPIETPSSAASPVDVKTIGLIAGGVLILGGIFYLVT